MYEIEGLHSSASTEAFFQSRYLHDHESTAASDPRFTLSMGKVFSPAKALVRVRVRVLVWVRVRVRVSYS